MRTSYCFGSLSTDASLDDDAVTQIATSVVMMRTHRFKYYVQRMSHRTHGGLHAAVPRSVIGLNYTCGKRVMDRISLSVCESSQGELNHIIFSDALSTFVYKY